jgi:hypothetical protein
LAISGKIRAKKTQIDCYQWVAPVAVSELSGIEYRHIKIDPIEKIVKNI